METSSGVTSLRKVAPPFVVIVSGAVRSILYSAYSRLSIYQGGNTETFQSLAKALTNIRCKCDYQGGQTGGVFKRYRTVMKKII